MILQNRVAFPMKVKYLLHSISDNFTADKSILSAVFLLRFLQKPAYSECHQSPEPAISHLDKSLML